MESAAKLAGNEWRQLVLKHTNGGACNFQSAAVDLAVLVEAAERERCAILCERNSDKWDTTGGDGGASLECADLIRSAE